MAFEFPRVFFISNIGDALRDLVPFVQIKHPWRSGTFSKVANFSL